MDTQNLQNSPQANENQFSSFEKEKLPNATSVLVLGIGSIITCCCYGFIGIILGAIGLVLAGKDRKLYRENPSLYSNYSNLSTGRTLCIIGIILSSIYLVYTIIVISFVGFSNLQDPNAINATVEELFD